MPLDQAFAQQVLEYLSELPPLLTYVVLGAGAAVENFFPPIPADTFVLAGAFLSEAGRATPVGVFAVTWFCNVASALVVYWLGRTWGQGFFDTAAGRWLLRPRQLHRLAALYDAHGFKVIFASRFLPGFRAVVPVFAGVSRLSFPRTAIPILLASGLWYGFLVYLGAMFRRNWSVILHALEGVNSVLLAVALVLGILFGWLWWRTRRGPSEEGARGGEGEW